MKHKDRNSPIGSITQRGRKLAKQRLDPYPIWQLTSITFQRRDLLPNLARVLKDQMRGQYYGASESHRPSGWTFAQVSAEYGLYVVGKAFATQGFFTFSDETLKTDIRELTFDMDKLMQLKPKHFKFKGSAEEMPGFIAQELQLICPDLVTKTTSGKLAVNSIGMLAYIIARKIRWSTPRPQTARCRTD